MFYFINIRNELTFTEANYALITCGNAVRSFFDLNEDIPFNTDAGVCSQQINLHALLCTMEIDDSLIIYNFHSKGYGNNVWIRIALHPNSDSITSVEHVENLNFILDFPFFSPHYLYLGASGVGVFRACGRDQRVGVSIKAPTGGQARQEESKMLNQIASLSKHPRAGRPALVQAKNVPLAHFLNAWRPAKLLPCATRFSPAGSRRYRRWYWGRSSTSGRYPCTRR